MRPRRPLKSSAPGLAWFATVRPELILLSKKDTVHAFSIISLRVPEIPARDKPVEPVTSRRRILFRPIVSRAVCYRRDVRPGGLRNSETLNENPPERCAKRSSNHLRSR